MNNLKDVGLASMGWLLLGVFERYYKKDNFVFIFFNERFSIFAKQKLKGIKKIQKTQDLYNRFSIKTVKDKNEKFL